MKTAKLGALFMVSLMALAGVGASYAVWSDQVVINATATTGDLEYKITDFWVLDQTTIGGQNLGIWTGQGDWGQSDSITVTVAPTYPGWEAICRLTVKNTGNLPLTLYSIKMTYVSGEYNLMNYYCWGIPSLTTLPVVPGTSLFYLNTFDWLTTERTYSGDLPQIPVITILPGGTQTVEAYFWLYPTVPQYEGYALTVTLTLEARAAAITY